MYPSVHSSIIYNSTDTKTNCQQMNGYRKCGVCTYIHRCCLVTKSCLAFVTAARQAPLPKAFLGKNTGVGCHFLLQGIFPI